MIVNMSVWESIGESIDELAAFVYRGGHVAVMRRRREWSERIAVRLALWWVPIGIRPTVGEAEERLAQLREHGVTPTHLPSSRGSWRATRSSVTSLPVPRLAPWT
jgi:hypothetical protein